MAIEESPPTYCERNNIALEVEGKWLMDDQLGKSRL